MNTAENNYNYFQNIMIFIMHLTLGSSPDSREKFDMSLKKEKKKRKKEKRKA